MDNFVLCDGAVIIGPTVGMLNGHRLIREATGICVLTDKEAKSPDDAEITYEFQACLPPGFAARVMSPISAEVRSHVDDQKLRRVIIIAGRNSQTLELAEVKRPFAAPER